tara:strand:- start:97 stop:564 length:468 start_codon:yes stop_codon:yes gene_type:complete
MIMKTPSLETRDDQKREERVAGFLEGLWGVSCHKLPTSYSLDYWIESQDKCFWCEVKCRSFGYDKYDTFVLSANKMRKGSSFALATGNPYITVYAMTDGVYMHEWKPGFKYDIRMNVSENPTYDDDNEPYIHIAKEDLVCLSTTPLGMDSNQIGF